MIVGGYTLDLYCSTFPTTKCGANASFHGKTLGETSRDARKAGWKFVGDDVVCKKCAKEKSDG